MRRRRRGDEMGEEEKGKYHVEKKGFREGLGEGR